MTKEELTLDQIEHIKSAAYTAITMNRQTKKGQYTYEEARKIVLKWMGFGLPEGETWDMEKYFNKNVSGHGPVMQETRLIMNTEKEAWEALEYFNLL